MNWYSFLKIKEDSNISSSLQVSNLPMKQMTCCAATEAVVMNLSEIGKAADKETLHDFLRKGCKLRHTYVFFFLVSNYSSNMKIRPYVENLNACYDLGNHLNLRTGNRVYAYCVNLREAWDEISKSVV